MSATEIKQAIERVRQELYLVFEERQQNLLDEEVIHKSQELDVLITLWTMVQRSA
jgi:hypothetical protein